MTDLGNTGLGGTELNRALGEIRSIRLQVARSTEFRGYGPLTLGVTAGLACGAGVAQAVWLPLPADHRAGYVALWLTVAVVSAALIATQMLRRAGRLHGGVAEEMVGLAVGQFLPAGVAGLLLPLVLLRAPAGVFWVAPGLWQVVFSLGVFASCRGLPRAMLGVGCWFLATGMGALLLGDARALAPWVMAGPYAVGMGAVALIQWRAGREDMGGGAE